MEIKLYGDQSLAVSWIPWAKSRFAALKTEMADCGTDQMSRQYFIGGVEVVVESILGMNEIRITVAEVIPGLYICGQVKKNDGMWAWLLEKRSFFGASIWQKIFNATTNTSYSNAANGLAIDSKTGDLYVCGNVHVEIPGKRYWKLEKRSPDGDLIWGSALNLKGEAYAVTVTDEAVYVAGHSLYIPLAYDAWDWRVEKRSKADGSLIWQQTISVLTNPADPFTHQDSGAYGVAALGGFVYVCGLMAGLPYVECRAVATGAIVWTKQLTTDGGIAVTGGWYNSVRVVGSSLYLAGTRKFLSPGIYDWKIEQRNAVTGDIAWTQTYENHGLPETAHNAQAMDLATEGDYIFACGYDGGNNPDWRVEKRAIATGALIWAKRPDWTLGYPYSSEPQAIAVRKGVSYAGGYKSQVPALNTQFYLESYNADGTLSQKVNMSKFSLYSQISDIVIGVR